LNRLEPAGAAAFSAPAEEKLELAEVAPPKPQSLPGSGERAPKRRSPMKLVLLAFGLGLGLLVVALVRGVVSPPPGAWREEEVRPATTVESMLAPQLGRAVIQSDPPGASIVFKGQVVGTTPWAGDNSFGTQPLELRLEGYKPWRGALKDQADATLSVRLTETKP